ncbi:MAG: hypothetical protein AB1796_01835 [Bacillota bacterium]
MKSKGQVRKFFPGANSAYGFYSFYDQLYGPAFEKVFIFKGGPGTGKSSLLHMIGEEMRSDGFDVEYHYCSAAPHCLDAIVIPAAGLAILDGTAPHVMDPRYPGAVEQIINLGAFWDEAYLVKHRDAIRKLVDEIGDLYRKAYVYLSAAKGYRDAVESYYGMSNHYYIAALENLTLELVEEIFGGKSINKAEARMRKLFASAITSQGTMHHLENLVNPFSLVFVLSGEDGRNKKIIMERVAQAALMRGFYVEAFHCALDPRHIDHLLIPELEVALVNSMEAHCPELGQLYRDVDTSRFAAKLPEEALREKNEFLRNYDLALQNAVTFLHKANQQHDELERYYIPAMRYDGIEKLGEEILEKIRRQVRY